jgi:hypothetical protein
MHTSADPAIKHEQASQSRASPRERKTSSSEHEKGPPVSTGVKRSETKHQEHQESGVDDKRSASRASFRRWRAARETARSLSGPSSQAGAGRLFDGFSVNPFGQIFLSA